MLGRRIPDGEFFGPVDREYDVQRAPGDYGLVHGYTGDKMALFFILPDDLGLAHITFPPHSYVEEDDGTITVSPSILCRRRPDEEWHGYLERGVWREV